MEKNNELKKGGIKSCTCYYFGDIINVEDFSFNSILLDKKSYENILIYDVLYKNFIDAKPLRIMFDKVDRFIRDYGGTRYLVIFGPENYDAIFDRIRYLIGLKSSITNVVSHNYAKIKIDSNGDFPLEKTLTMHAAVMLIKSVFNNNQIQYYYNVFLVKCLYQSAEK